MVRRKPCTSPVRSSDLAKVRFKPGKFVILKTVKTQAIQDMASTNINTIDLESTPGPSEGFLPNTIMEAAPSTSKTDTGIKSTLKINVPVSNKYQALENEEEMDVQASQTNKQTLHSTEKDKTRTTKPPPIVLHYKINSLSDFVQKLKKQITKGFHIKNTKNNTNIFINDTDEYRRYLKVLEAEEVNFHSYTEKGNKTHTFVLKGIDGSITTEEIKENIETNYTIKVVNIYKMRNTTRDSYMVITDNTIFLRYLNANVKYVCHTKISWERHTNRNTILQCRRCQRWGHSTSNCRSKPICTKCGKEHWTKDCQLVNKNDESTHENITCANCKGNHLAFSRNCPVYQSRLTANMNRKNTTATFNKKPEFVPAPTPTTNPWMRNQKHVTERTNIEPNSTQNLEKVSSVIYPQSVNPDPQSNFSTLTEELNVLNQLIDLEKMVRLVKELNLQLRGCTNELDKFLKFNKFCQNFSMANTNIAYSCNP